MEIAYQIGFPDQQRNKAAELYEEAFRAKLRPAIAGDNARIVIIAAGLNPSKCIAAIGDGELLGVAGFHDNSGSMTDGITFGTIRRQIGLARAVKAIAVLALFERKAASDELLMDGIVVDTGARGRGIGTGLFARLEDHARENGCSSIRLDVVDTNPGARRLYERLGFVATKTERTPYLRWLGFTGSTTMVKQV